MQSILRRLLIMRNYTIDGNPNLNIKRILAGDRGYRGKKEVNGTRILIPDIPKPSDSRYQKRKKHQLFCKRAGIEPTIGHLKSDHRLGRNFYKGLAGDAINILLAAAAYNFKCLKQL